VSTFGLYLKIYLVARKKRPDQNFSCLESGKKAIFVQPLETVESACKHKRLATMHPGDVLRDRYREVLFGEVWNGTSSPPGGVAETKVSERLAEFPFLSPSILRNDGVLYHSLLRLTSPQQVLGAILRDAGLSCK
jgi:hypothetical protein